MDYSPTELEALVRQRAPEIAHSIRGAASQSNNEAALVAEIEDILKRFEKNFDLNLRLDRERTLINGRADAVYNRFVIEYEPPGSLRKDPSYSHNKHAVGQAQQYMDEIERLDRHKKERMAGVAVDGFFFIFVRYRDEHWWVDDPIPVSAHSTETFLRYLISLSTELALTPENLVRDFGENSVVARQVVPVLYKALGGTKHPKVDVLFKQWRRQFSEITGWEKQSSRLDLPKIARNFGIKEKNPDPLRFFFSIHTYYATFIKLLAVQIAQYYMMPEVGSGLKHQATIGSDDLCLYLQNMERGGLFKELGISNFLEGDFFGWYLEIWGDEIDRVIRRVVADLGNYSLVTLDVDPEETRDLLKQLYQNLMPKTLRHALGEYYTPDWLAERLLNQLGYIGDPQKRVLDPACGSGTFLVLALRRIRSYADNHSLTPSDVLSKTLGNVVGFDLNPLAVIAARTNYLLALGDLLQHRQGEIAIPVYLADSILTPRRGADLFTQNAYGFNTAVGRFSIPKSLVQARYIDQLANLLEASVQGRLSHSEFQRDLLVAFPLDIQKDKPEIDMALSLYDQLLELDRREINGIWARIIKNAFAPRFVGRFDYVIGNPPWVNWESLPEDYRQETTPLWRNYKLFEHTGFDAILGKSKDDISILMTYVALDEYLDVNGRLGFIITQSVFKTAGAGKGFRRFQIGEKLFVQVLHVDDMSAMKPFEGASNRTSVVIMQKGSQTKYPVPYTFWRKTAKGKGLRDDDTLDEILKKTAQSRFIAEPIDEQDLSSSWISGKSLALKAARKVIGNSDYQARAGVCTWLNAVYWLDIVNVAGDNKLVVRNVTEKAKRKVDNVQTTIEMDLIYPLLQGRDIARWYPNPAISILITHELGMGLKAISEIELEKNYPGGFGYLKHFEKELRSRSGYKRYFKPDAPFYSLFNIGDYTFAPYKVVWTRVDTDIKAGVIGSKAVHGQNRIIVPIETATMVPFENEVEAHYFCSCINSTIFRFVVKSYSVDSTGGFGSPHILTNVKIPLFSAHNSMHLELSQLSKDAHFAVSNGQPVSKIEKQIDQIAGTMWGLSPQEIVDIQQSFIELS